MAIKVKVDLSGLKRVRQELFDRLAGEQTQRLIAYAPELLKKAYSESGFTDQTYNLADSYIWAVFYQGNLKGSGYLYPYQMATKNSKYHGKLTDGRKLADEFLANYTPATYIGWDLVLAATVPYAPILKEEILEIQDEGLRCYQPYMTILRKILQGRQLLKQ